MRIYFFFEKIVYLLESNILDKLDEYSNKLDQNMRWYKSPRNILQRWFKWFKVNPYPYCRVAKSNLLALLTIWGLGFGPKKRVYYN